jgi:hypothetical protein
MEIDRPNISTLNTSVVDANVNHPVHYCDGGVETIDYIRAKLIMEEFVGYCKGNVIKYISRAGKKTSSPLEDFKKAKAYLEWAIEAYEKK